MAMLLIAAEIIVKMKHRLHGTVKLLFQPGEEGYLGAKKMVDAKCLENPHVDQVVRSKDVRICLIFEISMEFTSGATSNLELWE
jgi:hypothetical protein